MNINTMLTKLGPYYLKQPLSEAPHIKEFSSEEYRIFEKSGGMEAAPQGEKIYTGGEVSFLNNKWSSTIGSIKNIIYTIAIQNVSTDEGTAEILFKKTLDYLTKELGDYNLHHTIQHPITGNPVKLYRWDKPDGDVLITFQNAFYLYSLDIMLTSNIIHQDKNRLLPKPFRKLYSLLQTSIGIMALLLLDLFVYDLIIHSASGGYFPIALGELIGVLISPLIIVAVLSRRFEWSIREEIVNVLLVGLVFILFSLNNYLIVVLNIISFMFLIFFFTFYIKDLFEWMSRKLNNITWDSHEHSDEENSRWALLRAIEWGEWPAFITQPIVPIFFLFFSWWFVVAAIIILDWIWAFTVRYKFVMVRLAYIGPLFVLLKFPVCIIVGIHFLLNHNYWMAILSGFWPLLMLVFTFLSPPTQIGKIQKMFMNKLGYSENSNV